MTKEFEEAIEKELAMHKLCGKSGCTFCAIMSQAPKSTINTFTNFINNQINDEQLRKNR